MAKSFRLITQIEAKLVQIPNQLDRNLSKKFDVFRYFYILVHKRSMTHIVENPKVPTFLLS